MPTQSYQGVNQRSPARSEKSRQHRLTQLPTRQSKKLSATSKSHKQAKEQAKYLETYKDFLADEIADDGVDEGYISSEHDTHRLSYTTLDTLHDPFLGGRQGLTQRQLALAHIYMNDLGPMLFGTPVHAVFRPSVIITQTCLEYSEAGALWAAICTEEIIHSLNQQPPTTELIQARALGRKSLEMALRNRHLDFQAAYIAIVKAAQVSLFFGNAKVQRTQTLAADMLIQSAGGLRKTISLLPDIDPFYIPLPFLWASSPFSSQTLVELTLSNFLQSVQETIQCKRFGGRAHFSCSIEDLLNNDERMFSSEEYLELQAEAVRQFEQFQVFSESSSTSSRKFQLCFLIEICAVFSEPLSRPDVVFEILKRIKYLLGNSFPPAKNRQRVELRAVPLGQMVNNARREIMAMRMPKEYERSVLRVAQMQISAMKIIHLLSSQCYDMVVDRLFAWFKYGHSPEEPFTVDQVSLWKAEVVENWLQQEDEIT